MKRLIFILLLLTFITSATQAQDDIVNKSGSSNIAASINLAVTTAAITIAAFNTQTAMETGLETSVVRFVIKSNKNWKLATEIGTITATAVAEGPAIITSPLSYTNINYLITPADNDLYSDMVSFSGSIANVKTGVKGNIQKTGNTFNLKFRIIPGFQVDPGIYTIPLIYTVSEQ